MSDVLLQKVAAPTNPLRQATALLQPGLSRLESALDSIVSSTVELIPEVSKHLIGSGGKRIRPILLMLMGQACDGELEQTIDLAVASELLHNATLLHDDVVDRGHLRRGVTAAPKVYGNSASVLVGDFLLAQGFGIVVRFGDLDVLTELSRVVTSMAEGEILQLIRSGRTTLSLEGYEEIISGKTAGLFSWCCYAGARLGKVNPKQTQAALKFGRAFGMAFQVTDDVMDYTATVEESGKDLANDLRQGKTTLPLLLACEEDKNLLKKVESLAAGDPDPEECCKIVKRVLATSGVAKAMEKASNYINDALDFLSTFPDRPAIGCLADLAQYIIQRVPAGNVAKSKYFDT